MTSALYKLRSFPVTTKMILDLPYDIREIILKELLVSPRPLEELPYIYHQQNKAAQRTMPTIPGLSGQVLRVCQLLREEGTHILYGDNVACIRLRVYNSQYPEVSILGSIPVLGKTWLNHRLQGNEDCGRDHDLRRLAGRFTKLSILLSCAPQEDEPTGSWATMLLSMFCEWLSSVPGFDQKQIEIEVGADLFPQLEVPLETLTVLRGRNITMKGLSEDTCNRWAQSFRAGTSSPFIHRMGFIVKDL